MQTEYYLKKNFKRWEMEPSFQELFKDSFFVEKIDWNSPSLQIILEEYSEDRTKVKLLFEGNIYSYTNTLEGFKPSVWIGDGEEYYPFYYSYSTEEIKNLCKNQEYIENEVIHFLIIGIDNVLDVFCSEFPSMEKLDS